MKKNLWNSWYENNVSRKTGAMVCSILLRRMKYHMFTAPTIHKTFMNEQLNPAHECIYTYINLIFSQFTSNFWLTIIYMTGDEVLNISWEFSWLLCVLCTGSSFTIGQEDIIYQDIYTLNKNILNNLKKRQNNDFHNLDQINLVAKSLIWMYNFLYNYIIIYLLWPQFHKRDIYCIVLVVFLISFYNYIVSDDPF